MTRMDRRKEIQANQKKIRIKLILVLAFVTSTLLFYFFGPEMMSRLFHRETPPPAHTLIYNGEPGQTTTFTRQGVAFLPVDWVKSHLLPELEILEQSAKARWIPHKNHLQLDRRDLTDLLHQVTFPIEINLMEEGGVLYFPISGVAPLLGVTVEWRPEYRLLVVNDAHRSWQQGEILKKTTLRTGTRRLDPGTATLEAGETLQVLAIYENHYQVLSESGQTGFVPQAAVGGLKRRETDSRELQLKSADPHPLPHPFGLVWDYVSANHPDRSEEFPIDALHVFSPTWFELKNEAGDLENRGQFRYAQTMKNQGYQLWGLVTNAFDPDLTENFMLNPEGRRRFINQLMVYAALYELDGINIDFENIHYRNQDLFTDFVGELSETMREQGLIVSIDVTIPGGSLNWSQVYDRSALEPHVDYFAVMTYDEHWGSSPVAGSVASLDWVERGIAATLEEVPASKVLLGLPLYTRLWEETPRAGGGVSVSSRAMGMQFIRRTLEENGVTEEDWEWLEDIGQYYAEYEAEGKRYRVWLEDERSLGLKAGLIQQYELGGFAGWRKDFELPAVWDMLEESLEEARRSENP
ncbi:Glycosyl hydrolases family 18 [Anoxynatronum buryatiense]|uniref:Glycosyl hydrolases family 18 n=2 Tax=Anoxynatronum buryatiense TaxID=489973 RepID=A0AA46AKA8_9CLOT|nr:Glycosyl hydrolases family 18 [Anoxynatronum buryatiense]